MSGTAGVVATESPAAARAGRDVLARGGNAIDAAVSTVFALGVARPQSCGIGGGGFMLYRSPDGKVRALDYRETAGAAMKVDSLSGPGLHKTFTGHLTVGVPGTLAGMASALERFGTIPLRDALAPASEARQRRVPGADVAERRDGAAGQGHRPVPGGRGAVPQERRRPTRPATCSSSRTSPRRCG